MLNRLVISVFICAFLMTSCGVKEYLGRNTSQAVILDTVKENGLLVRLRSADAKLEAMLKYGKDGKAESLQAEIENYNTQLINGLREKYDFSEVYFYYGRDADAIFKTGDYSSILDINLEPAKVSFSNKPGVLLTERFDMTLHRWDIGRMVELDKMVYPKYSFRFFTLAFAKPTVAEVMLLSIPLMNSDFHGLYDRGKRKF